MVIDAGGLDAGLFGDAAHGGAGIAAIADKLRGNLQQGHA